MRPAFSLIFFTVLIGMAQGLFLLVYLYEIIGFFGVFERHLPYEMIMLCNLFVLMLTLCGVAASLFHLKKPRHAWRVLSQWRTSWLSREVLFLLIFFSLVVLWGVFSFQDNQSSSVFDGAAGSNLTIVVGGMAAFAAIYLYVCTGMVYVAIKVIREWSTPMTIFNFLLLGLASGGTLVALVASMFHEAVIFSFYAVLSMILILMSAVFYMILNSRNKLLKRCFSINDALGIQKETIHQVSAGVQCGSYNIYEFFHRATKKKVVTVEYLCIFLAFIFPFVLIFVSYINTSLLILGLAMFFQFFGLLGERWLFFVRARHPQNNYYQINS